MGVGVRPYWDTIALGWAFALVMAVYVAGFKNVFYTTPAAGYEGMVFTQYLTEIVGTFLLVLLIHAIADGVRNVGPGAHLWPFMVDAVRQRIGPSAGIRRG